MKTFLIHVLNRSIFKSYELDACIGEIQIGAFKESFEMPLDFWAIEDYEQQWKEGIERLKTHNESCLVTELQDPVKAPWLMMWSFYKEGNTVYIRNNFIFARRIIATVKKQPFTLQTCYNFITPRVPNVEKKQKVSEWVVDLKDIIGE